ncbi:MAG: diacylglycerol kinase family protein [Sphingobacteriales bacterium]|jgi:diacylglycerol kinase|nr:MAG: diacylglycerol kinase family protein [Sphingobacteriales bacterium]
MEKKRFSLLKQIKSFKYAINGMKILVADEHNSRIHIFFMLLAISCGFIFKISIGEWITLCVLFGIVFLTELINSAIENLCNYLTMENNITIGKIKDLSAAAVLVAAITSFVVGCIIFIPKFLLLFK